MSGPEQGHHPEQAGQVKLSREADIAQQYAELSEPDQEAMARNRQEVTDRALADPTHAEHNQMVIAEGNRKREALHRARADLLAIETGEAKPENKHEAWEAAMASVEAAKQDLHGYADNNPVRYETGAGSAGRHSERQLHLEHGATSRPERGQRAQVETLEAAEEAGAAVGASAEEVQEDAVVVRADSRGIQGREVRNYLGTEEQRGMWRSDKYKALANEIIARSIADKEYANDLMSNKNLGRDRSDVGISGAMAAAALPFLEQAAIADRQGRHNRAEILRQAAADTANRIGRDMDFDQSMRVLSGAGAEPSINGVRVRPSRRVPNALKKRSMFERMGVSWKALRARD